MTKNLHLKLGKLLFALAEKNHSLEETFLQLKILNKLFADKKLQFKVKYLNRIEVKILSQFAKEDLQLNELMKNLLVILWKSKLIDLLPKILEIFKKNYFSKVKISEMELIIARQFSEQEMENIIKKLKAKTEKKLEISIKISDNLIGGIQIFNNGKLTDLSIKARLTQLKQVLSN